MSTSQPLETTVTVDDSDPETLLIIAGTILFFALISFGLARLARRLPSRVPTVVLIVACASLTPLILVALGFAAFVSDQTFIEWITTRAPRAYRNVALVLGASLLTAALGVRRRRQVVDPSVFD